jgi:23S rRNA pseudouridine1911/1915/1917 synthase
VSREPVIHQLEIPAGAPARLDQALCVLLSECSRSQLQDWIRRGCVQLAGQVCTKPGTKVRPGEGVRVAPPPPEPLHAEAEDLPLDVLYEDADVLVLNKAAGMVVHPAAGHWSGTLVNALLHHCEELSEEGGEDRPGIVHRLDKETSGCLAVAKHDRAHRALAAQFAGRGVLKIYIALALGSFRTAAGSVQQALGRHPVHRQKMAVLPAGKGREARTDWRVLGEVDAYGARASVVQCRLHTGRTHQIRVHLAHLGHGLLGDAVYGRRMEAPRHMLHAWKLGFAHPGSGEWMEFLSPLPEDFRAAGVDREQPVAMDA